MRREGADKRMRDDGDGRAGRREKEERWSLLHTRRYDVNEGRMREEGEQL